MGKHPTKTDYPRLITDMLAKRDNKHPTKTDYPRLITDMLAKRDNRLDDYRGADCECIVVTYPDGTFVDSGCDFHMPHHSNEDKDQ